MGFLFGLLRGAVVVSLVWIGYEWFVPPKEQPEWIFEARTMPMIIQGAEMLKALAPAGEEEPIDEVAADDSEDGCSALPGPPSGLRVSEASARYTASLALSASRWPEAGRARSGETPAFR